MGLVAQPDTTAGKGLGPRPSGVTNEGQSSQANGGGRKCAGLPVKSAVERSQCPTTSHTFGVVRECEARKGHNSGCTMTIIIPVTLVRRSELRGCTAQNLIVVDV